MMKASETPKCTICKMGTPTATTEIGGAWLPGGSGSNGVENVADPRANPAGAEGSMGFFGGTYGVAPWSESSGAITGRGAVSTGTFSVADPRVKCAPRAGAYGVTDWSKPAKAVTGATSIDAAEVAVADPRVVPQRGNANMHRNKYQVRAWDEATGTVTGASRPGSGAQGVADPRVALKMSADAHANVLHVTSWDDPTRTVTGATRPSQGAVSVADPRGPGWFGNVLRVVPWGDPAAAVTSGTGPTNGGGVVADPRVKVAFDHGYKVTAWNSASDTIAAGSHPGQGAYSVQDPRVDKAALIGIITLTDARATLMGGIPCPFAIVDPSVDGAPLMVIHDVKKAPPAAPVILAADGTWHRPLTLLEKAVLQGLPAIHNGAPLQLAGTSSSQSERVGNAVPLQAATAIAEQMLLTLLSSDLGAFALSSGGSVWVTPPAEASVQ